MLNRYAPCARFWHIPVVKGFHSKKDEYEYIAKQIKLLMEDGMQPEDIACIAYKKSELAAIGAELTRQDSTVGYDESFTTYG